MDVRFPEADPDEPDHDRLSALQNARTSGTRAWLGQSASAKSSGSFWVLP